MAPFIKPPTISDDYRSADLYRQAADVFFEKGFEATSMDELAESVDLSQGGLYYYIKGKAALLFAIMNYGLDRLETEVLNEARRLEDPEACFQWMLQGYLQILLEELSVMTLLHGDVESLEDGHRRKVTSRKGLFLGFLQDVVASILYARGVEDVDPAEAVDAAIEQLHQLGAELAGQDPATVHVEEVAGRVVQRALQGEDTGPVEAEALAG